MPVEASHRGPFSPALRALVLVAACGVGAAACAADGPRPPVPQAAGRSSTAPPPSPSSSVEGVYAMPAPLVSELRVSALPGRPGVFRVEVHGGGDPADGAAVGADCQALAEGALAGDRIDAPLLPFESPLGGLEADDLAAAPRLQLTVEGDQALLAGTFPHCAMATRMAGRYLRTRAPRLLGGCPPLPAACWMRD